MKVLTEWLKWLPFALLPAILLCTSVDFDDLNGNVTSDSIPPVITINGDNPDTINVGESWEEPIVIAIDNIDGNLTDSIKKEGTVDTSKAGDYKIYYEVSDLSLNTAEDSLIVVVIDTTTSNGDDSIPPTLTISGNNPDTINVGEAWTNPTATASDNVDGNLSDSVKISGEVKNSIPGTYKLIYSVSDKAGNKTEDTLIVVVENNSTTKQPKLILNGVDSVLVTLGTSYIEPGFIVVDTSGDTLLQSLANALVAITKYDSTDTELVATDTIGKTEGLFKISYVLNYEGSVVVEWRKVRVTADDVTPPVITILGNDPDTVWNSAASNYIDIDTGANAGAIAIDNGIDTLPITVTDSVTMSTAGSYKIYYSAEDSSGNRTDTFRVVVVQIDDVDPVLSLNKTSDTITVGETWDSTTIIATANDNADGDISASIIISGQVDNSKKGINKIAYTISDAAGNSVSDTVMVYVFALPTITLLGDNPDTVILGAAAFLDDSAQVIDNIDDTINVASFDANTLDLTVENTDTIHYTYTDADGNKTDTIGRVIVVYDVPDTVAPTITITGKNPDTIWVDDSYNDPGATAIDEKDGPLTDSIKKVSTIDTAAEGSYSITYTVSDAAGNADTATRVVVVKADKEAPVITIEGPNPDTIWIGDSYSKPSATATDNKDGDVPVSSSGEVKTDSAAVYTITYSATDAAGNTGTKDLKVVVKSLGNEVVFENFDAGQKGQHTLAVTKAWGNGAGYWYVYTDASEGGSTTIEPDPNGSPYFGNNVVDSAAYGGTTYGLHMKFKLKWDSNDPYAGLVVPVKDTVSYFDFSSMTRMSFWVKGTANSNMRLSVYTKKVIDGGYSWGHFGYDFTLTGSWQQIKISQDDLKPEPYSPVEAAGIKWSDSDVRNKVNSFEFTPKGVNGDNIDFYLDEIKIYGVIF